MKVNTKISLIVIFQISLIIGSFLSMTILESQMSLTGNSVNVAGKNRLLTSQFLNEVKDYVYVKNSQIEPEIKLNELKENIILLKNGGTDKNIEIKKLDKKFINQWNDISQQFEALESDYEQIKVNDSIIDSSTISVIENHAILLIFYSDILVEQIAISIDETSQKMITLQLILLIVNVGIHVGLLFIIFRIIKKFYDEKLKMEKLTIVGELSSRLAHDIRNPLSIIQGNIDLMKNREKSQLTQDELKKFDSVDRAIGRIDHQINKVLDFVQGKPLEMETQSIHEILNSTIADISKPEKIKIDTKGPDVKIDCDFEGLKIVLINLITNAIQSIGTEGTIKINVVEKTNFVLIEVEDSGPGIPEANLSTIFDPLFTTKQEGTGLGLVSCKSLIELHKGTISVKNNPTTFTITLPLVNSEKLS